MKAYIFLLTLLILLFSSNLYAGDKVYTNDDLEKYKSGNDEATYQYNQRVMQRNRREFERQEAEKEYIEKQRTAIDEQNNREARKKAALDRIDKLEKERAQDKIDGTHEFIGGYVGKRRAEERRERTIKREQELDKAYRDAELSRERELQKRTEEAEAKAKAAEGRAMQGDITRPPNTPNTGETIHFDSKTGRYIHCPFGGTFCY
jgi:hypothetical protein